MARLPKLSPNEQVTQKLKYLEKIVDSRAPLDDDFIGCLEWIIQFSNLNDSSLAFAFNVKGKALKNLELYDEAIEHLLASDSLALKVHNINLQASNANALGIISIQQGDYVAAIDFFLHAKSIAIKKNDARRALKIDTNIALLYKRQGRFKEAVQILEELKRKLDEKEVVFSSEKMRATVYHNLGNVYESAGNFKSALLNLKEAIKIKQDLPNRASEALSWAGLFSVLGKLNRFEEAQEAFEHANEIASELNANRLNQYLYQSWGDVMLAAHKYQDAIDYYEVVLDIAILNGDHYAQHDIFSSLSEAYEQLGEYQLSLAFAQKQYAAKDSLVNEDKMRAIKQTEARYQFQAQEAEIQLLKKQKSFQQLTIAGTAALAIAILFALLALYRSFLIKARSNQDLLDSNKEIQRQYVLLSQRNREISDKNELLSKQKQQLEAKNTLIARRNRELRQANETLEQFSYVASHDLTQPLRTIRSFLGLLETKSPELTHTSKEYLRFAKDGTDKLVSLVRALLAYNRVGRQQAELDLIDLNDTLAQVHLQLAIQFEQTHGSLETAPLPEIKGIAAETYLVFQNLVSNALKFRHPERNPVVQVFATQDRDWHYIHVKDNGIGIKSEDQTKVFGMLRKLNGEQYEGAGIGLAICQRIVRGVGGEISVTSTYGQGSTFVVQWPRNVESLVDTSELQAYS